MKALSHATRTTQTILFRILIILNFFWIIKNCNNFLFLTMRFPVILEVHLNQDTQSAFTYSKLTIETLKQGVKYVQS